MIIPEVAYTHFSGEVLCSTTASLHMLLSYYGIEVKAEDLSEEFWAMFMSREFSRWFATGLDQQLYEESSMLACAAYLINKKYKPYRAGIHLTDLKKVMLSYLKRRMPVLVVGQFPILSGIVPNTVLLKGYVDDYFVVNDPRGNARSGYRDRLGEDVLYHCADLERWLEPREKDPVLVFRLLT